MANEEYVLLGMRINRIVLPQQLYVYRVPQKYIAQARGYLVKDNVPHVVRSSKEATDLEIYATSKSRGLKENMGLEPREEQPLFECELAGSAIRIKFLNSGWKRAVGKLYNPNLVEFNGEKHNVPINIYSALKTVVDKLSDDTYILFIDPAKKVEFTESLENIEQEYNSTILNEIQWVKIKDTTVSFDIVREIPSNIMNNVEERISDRNFREKLSRVLSEYSGVELNIDYSSGYFITTPRSNILAKLLKDEVGVPVLEQESIPIIPLPKNILTPVASIENINLFFKNVENRDDIQQKMTFLIPPKNRIAKINEILENIDLYTLNFDGLSIEIDVSNCIVSVSDSIVKSDISEYFSVRKEDLANWKPNFRKYREDHESKIAVLPIILNLQQNDYINAVQLALEELRGFSQRYRLKYLSELRCEPDIKDILSKLRGILKAYGGKIICAILFYHSSVDPGDRFIALYRYYVAKLEVHPYVVDLTEERLIEESKRIIRYKIGSVLKKFAVKMNAIGYRLNPPQIIRNYVIAGIDSTIYRTERGGLYPVAVVFVLNPDGEITVETYSGGIGFSDIDALVSGVESAFEHYGSRGLLAIINRSSVVGVLQKLIKKRDFQNHVSSGKLILASVSKTHSYSRILVKESGKIYNPSKPGVLVKLSDYSLDGGAIHISRFLSITTIYSRERFERGTIKPVIINIASQIEDRDCLEIAKYIVSLSHFARIGSLWAPSLPMPLHVANNYCRKLSGILKALREKRGIPSDIVKITKYL